MTKRKSVIEIVGEDGKRYRYMATDWDDAMRQHESRAAEYPDQTSTADYVIEDDNPFSGPRIATGHS